MGRFARIARRAALSASALDRKSARMRADFDRFSAMSADLEDWNVEQKGFELSAPILVFQTTADCSRLVSVRPIGLQAFLKILDGWPQAHPSSSIMPSIVLHPLPFADYPGRSGIISRIRTSCSLPKNDSSQRPLY